MSAPRWCPPAPTPLTRMDNGRLFPVCCATDISAEVKDRFLRVAQDEGGVDHNLVFVDSIEEVYTDESDHGYSTSSAVTSPFKGKTPEECSLLLQQLRRNGSDIDFTLFAIMDDRSLEDDTVLLVQAPVDKESSEFCGSVRVVFNLANIKLLSYCIGDSGAVEDQEKLRATGSGDDVLREGL